MPSFIKKKFSESSDGKGILIGALATPGTLIHTAVGGQSSFDEIWIWATNTSVSNVLLTIEWGEVTNPDGYIKFIVAAQDGLKMIIPGLILQNSLEVRAFAATINVLVVHGFVNLIS